VGAKFSAPVRTDAGAHPTSCIMGTGSFPGIKLLGRGVDHPPHIAPRLKKVYRYTLLPLWALVACFRVNFFFFCMDEWSSRRTDLYLTTHNTHRRQTSMPPARFKPIIPASKRRQTHARMNFSAILFIQNLC